MFVLKDYGRLQNRFDAVQLEFNQNTDVVARLGFKDNLVFLNVQVGLYFSSEIDLPGSSRRFESGKPGGDMPAFCFDKIESVPLCVSMTVGVRFTGRQFLVGEHVDQLN